MVVVKKFLKEGRERQMKRWASFPRETTFIRIPGLKNLKENKKRWVNHTVIRSCSRTESKRKATREFEKFKAAEEFEADIRMIDDAKKKAPAFLQS